ncbi:MAG: aldose epimerase, partial [Pseudonocardiales bacterium]
MALSGQQYDIVAGDHEATVVEVGAGLRRYAHHGVDVTVTYSEIEIAPKGCGAVLVPWPNRLRGGQYTFDDTAYQLSLTEPLAGNAIHGLGRWARWDVVRHERSAVTLALDVVPQPGYPFQVRVEVTYALDPQHGLSVTVVARNTGTNRAPFGAGFHPYLAVHGHDIGDVTVKVPARERVVLDDAKLPVGVRPVTGTRYDLRRGRRLGDLRMDDGFTGFATVAGRSAVEVRTRSGGAQVWFDETFRFVQVYTPGVV